MKIREDIAERLRAGMPLIHIVRELHVATLTVQRTREVLGLPAPKTCRVLPATLEEAFRRYERPAKDGHIEWAGPFSSGAPKLVFEGSLYYARRLAFRFHHGREPVGRVTHSCDVKDCVAGACVEDKPMRAANKRADRAFEAIFGVVA